MSISTAFAVTMTDEDYNRSDKVLEALRKIRVRKKYDEAALAEIDRARKLVLDRRAEYESRG